MSSLIRSLGGLSAVLLLGALPVRAGSVTADSIIDQESALQEATGQVPEGATVTGSRCQQIVMPGDSFRYRCSVEFTTTPPAAKPAP
ncbi:hypothetical protein VB734_13165 [Synechococcus sp. BA-124 BA4]|uniref:hypothetical protein n=1 Tax=unclassified Synechococcus TaxID=2626047 RepID=UPI0018CFDCC0|nr:MULTISPECIES: hypothetical protein [unclassified Synechococcus]MEA5400991.1 hypothetical protein [Synechococcus sp. BA-124 BA4]QPN56780.1 hypothetical protein I1E95_00795 [Synechococcus sp. CBW1107]CAK6696367.1 hypothetical protein BBFGKLBO_02036 [Synechococcus sp. CBW1107]